MNSILNIRAAFALLLLVFSSFNIAAQARIDLPESLGGSLGIYRYDGANSTSGFEYFHLEQLQGEDTDAPRRDQENRVEITGKLFTKDGEKYDLESASVRIVEIGGEEYYRDIRFDTRQKNGIRFTFIGQFAERVVQSRDGGPYIKITGSLTKYLWGRKVSDETLMLYEYGEA